MIYATSKVSQNTIRIAIVSLWIWWKPFLTSETKKTESLAVHVLSAFSNSPCHRHQLISSIVYAGFYYKLPEYAHHSHFTIVWLILRLDCFPNKTRLVLHRSTISTSSILLSLPESTLHLNILQKISLNQHTFLVKTK